jgi:hypothetical protein
VGMDGMQRVVLGDTHADPEAHANDSGHDRRSEEESARLHQLSLR